MRGIRLRLILLAPLVLLGCDPPSPRMPLTERIDSAGLEIVISSEPTTSWLRIAPTPDLRIGGADAHGAAQFGAVQGVAVASDGSIWVADRQTADVRVFEADGTHRVTVGGRGDGPGEFRVVRLLGQAGDSMAVVDDRTGRLSWFDLGGVLLTESLIHRRGSSAPVVYGVGSDGRLAGAIQRLVSADTMDPGTVFEGEIDFVGWKHPESPPRTIATVPTSSWLFTGTSQIPIPFTTNASLAVARHWVVTRGVRPELLHLSDDGGRRITRVRRAPRPVGADMRQAYEAFVRSVYPEDRRQPFLEALHHPAVPDTAPAYTRLLVDTAGRVWAQHFTADRRSLGDWDVFDPDGSLTAVVANPPGVWLHAITDRAAVGVWLDALDVPRVQRHAIVPPRASRSPAPIPP
ncbi:6-bladed beta-propeller [Gaopeijia maritima]|uniref:6-bladed beta-propeller n=1 Tax=Gaopeijia maritima TaxID=3119007 RepID=A0ABU9E6E2_9BACT